MTEQTLQGASTDYAIRPATVGDMEVIVQHRALMFSEMRAVTDYAALSAAFRGWLARAMQQHIYRGWLVEHPTGGIVAGGGLTVLDWPPHPIDLDERTAFIYNMYTQPAHRRRGLARQLMLTMHEWCVAQGIHTIRLHASEYGRQLYESLGYQPTNEMRVVLPRP